MRYGLYFAMVHAGSAHVLSYAWACEGASVTCFVPARRTQDGAVFYVINAYRHLLDAVKLEPDDDSECSLSMFEDVKAYTELVVTALGEFEVCGHGLKSDTTFIGPSVKIVLHAGRSLLDQICSVSLHLLTKTSILNLLEEVTGQGNHRGSVVPLLARSLTPMTHDMRLSVPACGW